MATPDHPDDPYQQALQDLTSFLHETSENIERILHTFCTATTAATTTSARNDEDSGSLNSFTATRSFLPNIGENPSSTSQSHLIAFMEGIMKTSHLWSAQHKAILKGKSNVGIVEMKPNELSKLYNEIKMSIAEIEEDIVGITDLEYNPKEASRMIVEKEEEKEGIVTLDSNPKLPFRSIKAEETCQDEDEREESEGIAGSPSCVKKDEGKGSNSFHSKSKKGSIQHGVASGRDSNVDSFLTPTKNDTDGNENENENGDAEDDDGGGGGGGGENSELPLTKWVPPATSLSDMKIQSYPRSIEVISSPEWLPEGWVTELKTRGSGNSAGTKDKYYVDPVSKRRFRSRKEVLDFLETGKMNRHRKRLDTSPIRKFSEPEYESSPPPTLAKQPIKRAKSKPNTMPTSSTPHATSSGTMGNMYMPFRTSQPSEWLMYESLASLPFPMFDPFRYAEMNANKSSANKGPPPVSNRPWFFTGPEASWMPFSGLGRPGEKGREYQNAHSMPSSYAPESVTKKRVRKSSKKTAT